MTRISDTPITDAAFAKHYESPALCIDELLRCSSALERKLRAYRKEGWVLVPREPTEEMLKAGDAIFCDTLNVATSFWRVMLAVAPEPQERP